MVAVPKVRLTVPKVWAQWRTKRTLGSRQQARGGTCLPIYEEVRQATLAGAPRLRQPVAAWHARIAGGRRGLDIAPAAACIGAGGRPTRRLAAIGRPTEDSVIGNDTLSRTLHPHADRWARRVVERAVSRARDPLAQLAVP